MAGRFEGLSDLEWKLFEAIFPPDPPKRGRGMPPTPLRPVVNSLIYILITRLPLVRSSVWAPVGLEERGASAAPALARREPPPRHAGPPVGSGRGTWPRSVAVWGR
jgi:hypothetical protein